MFSFSLSQLNWIRWVSKMQYAVTAFLSIFIKETYLSENMRHRIVINYYFFLLCINHCNFKVCNRNALDTWEERSSSAVCRGREHTHPASLPLCHSTSRQTGQCVQPKGGDHRWGDSHPKEPCSEFSAVRSVCKCVQDYCMPGLPWSGLVCCL